MVVCSLFFFKQNTAYEMRISDWSSDVCSSDLCHAGTKCHCVRDPTQGPRLHLGRGDRFAGAEFGRGGGECRLLLARVAPWKFRIALAKDRENLRFADFVEEGFRARSPVIGRLAFEPRAHFGLKAVTPTRSEKA